jgi:hypothetical protein
MGRTSTRSDLTPPCQLNNLLRQNTWDFKYNATADGRRLKSLNVRRAQPPLSEASDTTSTVYIEPGSTW